MMALGPTLIGALVGASAGVVVHVLLETQTNLGELPWFAIVTGLTTGLGVRFLNGQQAMNRASFLRAGIAASMSLAAIVLAPSLKTMVVQQQSPSGVSEIAGVAQNEQLDADEEEAPGENASREDARPQRHEIPTGTRGASGIGSASVQGKFDTWQFIFMAIGALLAYECARGKDAKPTDAAPPAEAPPKEDEVEPGDAEPGKE